MASLPSNTPNSTTRPGDDWFFAGLASSYPNIADAKEPYFKLCWPQPLACGETSSSSSSPPSSSSSSSSTGAAAPGCKVFHPHSSTAAAATTVKEIDMDSAVGEDAWLMREQVMVFRYKGQFHAVDHACPHRAYSMSWAQPFDIEDAGRVLGVGIRCRGHSYAFELSTGAGDRGSYRLGVWEVDLRPLALPLAPGVGSEVAGAAHASDASDATGGEGARVSGPEDREVWVRRKRRAA